MNIQLWDPYITLFRLHLIKTLVHAYSKYLFVVLILFQSKGINAES